MSRAMKAACFLPEKTITRAEAASMFYKLLRSVDWEPRTFSDVKSTAWYAEAVEALAGLGILSGYEDGTFGPDKEITRAEFVAIAVAFSALEDGQKLLQRREARLLGCLSHLHRLQAGVDLRLLPTAPLPPTTR